MLKNNDKANLVIALLIAIGLWVYVIGMENPTKEVSIKDVPITFLNEDTLEEEELTLLSVSEETIDVVISGNRSDAKEVKASDIRVYADLEGLKEGEHNVRLKVTGPDTVDIESKQKISVVIDQLVSVKKTVDVTFSGDVSDDSEPYIVQVNPQEVSITGAKTLVSRIAQLQAPLETERVGNALKSFTVTLKPVDKDGVEIKNVKLGTGSVSVSAVNLNKKTVQLDVPIIEEDAGDAERTVTVPKTITIKGMDANLKDISSITAKSIDISDIYEDTVIDVEPLLPDGIEVAANSQNLSVEVTVKGMESKTFEYSKDAVVVEGIEENVTAIVSDTSIHLTAIGKESIISGLDEDDFSFYVDVSDLNPGSHQVKLHCDYDEKLSRVDFTPDEVTVIIEVLEDGSGSGNDGEDRENNTPGETEPEETV